MKTDPRIDNQRVESINERYAGHLWNVIRLIKFWKQRPSVKTMPSYLLECLVLDLYSQPRYHVTARPEMEVARVLGYISNSILADVADPQGIQQNINKLPWEERTGISAKASSHAASAEAALHAQARGEERAAINHWKDVFGTDLPAFG